jgi:UDP-2,4-diacetamido-2,4,6-trideoxy-beta-L-altropyranose hydrolase
MDAVIRADASIEIGTGHVIRCATLARALCRYGVDVLFVCRPMPGDCCGWLESQGFKVLRLKAVELPLGSSGTSDDALPLKVATISEIDELKAALTLHRVPFDWVIVDHYGLDAVWERAVRPLCRRVMVIDDLADRVHDCDLLLDQNLVANYESRYEGKVSDDCRLMLGPRFALLQPEYAEWRTRVRKRSGAVRRLLIFFGGADFSNMTLRALEALKEVQSDGLVVDVVLGSSNPHRAEIEAMAVTLPNVSVYSDLPSLAPLMADADLAFGAGGTTTWERCCLGLPSIVVTLADNQVSIARELHRLGIVRWLGDAAEVERGAIREVLCEIAAVGIWADCSSRCMGLVDGAGTMRVVAAILATDTMPLRFRDARAADAELLLCWANDPVVRGNAFSLARIDMATHRVWLSARLEDRHNCRIYLAESDDGIPVGQVRFDRRYDYWLIDFSLDISFRRLGLGHRLLSMAIARLAREFGTVTLVGCVKEQNSSSLRVFACLGFELTNTTNRRVECRLTLKEEQGA